ncbi:MAG TPA: hypothetical protein VJZ49_13780 [Syntrophales bacterium]|nr:hypothetical protein [Syntrophales bacterium]
MEPVLEIKQLTMNFGGLTALDRVDLRVNKGKIVDGKETVLPQTAPTAIFSIHALGIEV